MQPFELPLTACLRWPAWVLIVTCAGLTLLLGIDLPWRLAAAGVTTATGVAAWRRYRRRRPERIVVGDRDRWTCRLGDQRDVTVADLRLGSVTPTLVSATLIAADGMRVPLFVPGCAIAPEAHWRLRRALLAWHPPGGQAGRAPRHPSTGA
ncbi:MAG: hypothetical protein QNJ91_04800 [Gammaproteobacteria bacterium]|nr:hypothetical protein [Gammaproteobacteria bacterium]